MAKISDIQKNVSGLASTTQRTVNTEPPNLVTTHKNKIYSNSNDYVVATDLRTFLKTLRNGVDYGTLPKVEGAILFKTGALKILKFLGLRHKPKLVEKSIDIANGFLGYTVLVTILNSDDIAIHEHLGSANTLEPKFIKKGFGADNTIISMATKRALVGAVKEIISINIISSKAEL